MAFVIRPKSEEEDVSLWLSAELRKFEEHLVERLRIVTWKQAPIHPYEGQIVIADGTSWNPGAGGGYYGYYNGSWTKL